uniref:C-type lectin domain family 18 member A n=1 Tax=Poecilia reticulata TaxID=8081 RepID=A0A3P9N0M2_POERE
AYRNGMSSLLCLLRNRLRCAAKALPFSTRRASVTLAGTCISPLTFARCRESATCRHYTQLVWTTSSHVGCASQQCLRDGLLWKIFACAGNWETNGRLVTTYKGGPHCSLCTSLMSGCFRLWDHVGGLCAHCNMAMSCHVAGNMAAHYDRLNLTSCKCECDLGFTGRFCQVRCSMPCFYSRFKEEECSCVCDVGFGGKRCSSPFTAVILR